MVLFLTCDLKYSLCVGKKIKFGKPKVTNNAKGDAIIIFQKIKRYFLVFKILLTLKCLMVILLQKGQALIVIKLID